MGNILELNEKLLEKWETICMEKEPDANFVKDGLLYRGDISYPDGCWERDKNGKEDILWGKCPIKVLFLMKDFTNPDMPDIRYETMRKNYIDPHCDPIKRDAFSMNILYWLYGLTHIRGMEMVPFSEIEDGHTCFEFYEKYPLVRINCKKVSGGSSISDSLLYAYLSDPDYSKLLKEQIELFGADIIVCCGGNSQIKRYVSNNIYNGCEKVNNWMFFNSEKKKLIIDSYHPSYFSWSRQSLYEVLMKNYLEFLSVNKDFQEKLKEFDIFEQNELKNLKYKIII